MPSLRLDYSKNLSASEELTCWILFGSAQEFDEAQAGMSFVTSGDPAEFESS
jgi:hypothetical protein